MGNTMKGEFSCNLISLCGYERFHPSVGPYAPTAGVTQWCVVQGMGQQTRLTSQNAPLRYTY